MIFVILSPDQTDTINAEELMAALRSDELHCSRPFRRADASLQSVQDHQIVVCPLALSFAYRANDIAKFHIPFLLDGERVKLFSSC